METRNRKKIHRKIVKILKDVNKNIADDNLWRGRFRAYEVYESFYEYSDGSGAGMFFAYVLCDLKTGRCKLVYEDMMIEWSVRSRIFWAMNDFICEAIDRFEECKHDKTNYIETKFMPPSFRDFRNARGAYSGSELYVEPAKEARK